MRDALLMQDLDPAWLRRAQDVAMRSWQSLLPTNLGTDLTILLATLYIRVLNRTFDLLLDYFLRWMLRRKLVGNRQIHTRQPLLPADMKNVSGSSYRDCHLQDRRGMSSCSGLESIGAMALRSFKHPCASSLFGTAQH